MSGYRNILVNALVNLGDVVLTTGAISLLKRAYPDARVTMLVRPVVREAVENNPVVDEVIIFDYKAKENSLGKMREMVRELRRRNFDLSISFDRKLRPALLAWLARIPVRVGPDRVFDDKPSRVTWFYTNVIHIPHDLDDTLQGETYQRIVRGFVGMDENIKSSPVMARIEAVNRDKAEKLFARLPKAELKIALCVKGTFPLKTWPKEYFAQVVEKLAGSYEASFFVVGAPGDRQYADEVIAGMGVPVENFCGETNLVDLAAVISKSDLFITVDTGATHIAATTGVPMVTMYGCTSPRRWYPYNDNARVLTSEENCCPCSVRAEECPSWPKPDCLYHVTPKMVLRECEELLNVK